MQFRVAVAASQILRVGLADPFGGGSWFARVKRATDLEWNRVDPIGDARIPAAESRPLVVLGPLSWAFVLRLFSVTAFRNASYGFVARR